MSAASAELEGFDIFFGFPEARELRAGVLDSDAEHVFTSGRCHSSAEAIRRLTAAQLIFAVDLPAEGSEDEVQGHVFGPRPRGAMGPDPRDRARRMARQQSRLARAAGR